MPCLFLNKTSQASALADCLHFLVAESSVLSFGCSWRHFVFSTVRMVHSLVVWHLCYGRYACFTKIAADAVHALLAAEMVRSLRMTKSVAVRSEWSEILSWHLRHRLLLVEQNHWELEPESFICWTESGGRFVRKIGADILLKSIILTLCDIMW